jgi:uncharacterized protein
MKIERELPEGRNAFTAYGDGYVAVNGARHERSVIVAAQALLEWAPRSIDALTAESLAPIVGMRPEIVLIGSGPTFEFPEQASLAPLHAARIGVEVMDTRAACRTYNILLSEGRNVVAALIV